MNKTLKITFTLLFSHLLAISSALAQDKDANAQAISSATSALDEFMLAFNSKSMKAWTATLNYPHARFASGTVTVWPSAEEFERGRTFERLPRTGWDHSSWIQRDASLVSSSKVHINTVFQRFNDKNEPIGT